MQLTGIMLICLFRLDPFTDDDVFCVERGVKVGVTQLASHSRPTRVSVDAVGVKRPVSFGMYLHENCSRMFRFSYESDSCSKISRSRISFNEDQQHLYAETM